MDASYARFVTVPFVLDTARLHLRRIDDGHLDDLVELDSDPEVMRFISGGVPTPREVYETSLLESGFKFRNPNVEDACGCGESIKFKDIEELTAERSNS